MKLFNKIWLIAPATALTIIACDKTDILPSYQSGSAPVLSSSVNTIAPAASDSNNVAVTFSWTSPKYATDSANVKYILEIDSTGKNFAKASAKIVMGSLSTPFIAKELNSILLAKGYAFNIPVDMDVRLKSSYGNNNELKLSNVVKIRVTPYKIPPKVALPASGRLFIVGDASTFGWSNDPAPPFPPAREFARLDETTWAGIMYMNGSGGYKILQTQGDWSTQFHMVNGGTANAGSFAFGDANPSFPSPTPAGWYKIILDFQKGNFTVTPYTGTLATELYIVGSATPGGDATGWNNPVPVPSQQFTRVNSSLFELTIALNANKSYLFLPVNGSWANKYGGTGGNNSNNVNGDEIKYNGSDMLAPAVSGNYKISVNFATGTAAGSSGRTTLVKL
jgi:hypothetical protein